MLHSGFRPSGVLSYCIDMANPYRLYYVVSVEYEEEYSHLDFEVGLVIGAPPGKGYVMLAQ